MDPSAFERILTARRILVLGSSGSGKTTLSIHLASVLKIEPIHLDAFFWKPGWISTPQPEWRRTVSSLIQEESWIMDGTYESTLDLRLPAADLVILVERSRLACLWRVLKRKLSVDDVHRPDAPAGQKLDRAFLRYIWQYPAVTRPLVLERIAQCGREDRLIQLKGSNDIARFVQWVQHLLDGERETH
jgi:adenylate kinase family enzyme